MKDEVTNELATIVANQYELVRRILNSLPDSTLDACENVNKLWSNAVKAERNESFRRRVKMFSWKGKGQTIRHYALYGIQDSDNHKELFKSLREWRENQFLKPKVSLTISVGDPSGGPEDSQTFLCDPFRVSQVLGTKNVQISSGGVVIAPVNERAQEIENLGPREMPAMASMVFPEFNSDVQVIPFSYSEEQIPSKSPLEMDSDSISDLIGSKVEASQVKCVVFMSNILQIKRTSLLIQSLGHLTERQIAIGGCIGHLAHDSTNNSYSSLKDMLQAAEDYNEDNPGKYARSVGLIFAGNGVKAASILLTRQIKTRGKVEEELKKFKQVGFEEQKSCAFMFACCGRGKNFYKGSANVESEVFRQLFPQTPLMGIFGNGEIGLTFLPTDEVKDTFSDPGASKRFKQKLLDANEFSHSFTTVFVMLSFH